MARLEPPTSWALPLAMPQKSTGIHVAMRPRLYPNDSTPPSLWLASRYTSELILAAWAHEQEHGGVGEVLVWAEGVAVRSIHPPTKPFFPVGDVEAFAEVLACAGLFLPVGMGLRPAIRAALWRNRRFPNAIQLFDGTRWLVLQHQGFRQLTEIVELSSPRLHAPLQVWTNSNNSVDDVAHLDSTNSALPTRPRYTSVTKAKTGFAKQLQQFFLPKEKVTKTTKKVEGENKPRTSSRSRMTLHNDIVQQLMHRQQLGTDKETQSWIAIADAYLEFNRQQAALARSHAAWLKDDLLQQDIGQGVRAVWLAALDESRRRGGDTLYLATMYDQLVHHMEEGLDRLHDLPEFLWPTVGDPTDELMELRGLFLEHGSSAGVGAAFAGLLFALAALNCHEPHLAASWLIEARDMLKEQDRNATTQSVLMLCDVIQRMLRIRIAEPDKVFELPCPKIDQLTRRCQLINIHRQRLQPDNPEWFLLGRDITFTTVDQFLRESELERTASVLTRNVLWLGAAGLCQTREQVSRWVALVPDAIELQAEFWRTRWPGESHLFDVQVRWCERCIQWALDDMRLNRLDAAKFLEGLFAQARERETPLRLALTRREWYVTRCILESGHSNLQKQWMALGLLSKPSELMLRGRNREADQVLDNLMHALSDSPFETLATVQTMNAILTACFLLPKPEALERGRNLTRRIASRIAQQGDEDVFAWKNLVLLDGLLSTLFNMPPTPNEESLAWIADDEQRIRKRMASDLARALAAVN